MSAITKFAAGIFGKASNQAAAVSAAPAPLAPPVMEDAQYAAEQAAKALAKRQGRASTVLTGGGQQTGAGSQPVTATRQLLGS